MTEETQVLRLSVDTSGVVEELKSMAVIAGWEFFDANGIQYVFTAEEKHLAEFAAKSHGLKPTPVWRFKEPVEVNPDQTDLFESIK